MNRWVDQWFSAQATEGGIIRRNRYDVEKQASVAEVVEEAASRGWHVVEVGDQIVVLCNEGDIRLIR